MTVIYMSTFFPRPLQALVETPPSLLTMLLILRIPLADLHMG